MSNFLPQDLESKRRRQQRLWLPLGIASSILVAGSIVGVGVHNNLTEAPEHPGTIQGWDLLTVDEPDHLPGDICEVAAEITDYNTDVIPDCLLLGAELAETSEPGTRIVVEVTNDNEVLVKPLG